MMKLNRCGFDVLAGLTGLALATGCNSSTDGPPTSTAAVPPSNVQVTHLRTGEIARTVLLPGALRAYQEAMLYAKVPGFLKSIAVDRGDWVKAGEVIAEIETPELLADRAKSQAELHVAGLELKRVDEAQKKSPDLIMPQTVDDARGRYEIAKASLDRIETLLGYSKIVAPFDGVITERWVDPGAFIPAATSSSAARTAAVVTLMDFSRVRVDVPVPEPEVPHVKNELPVRVTVEALAGREFEGKVTRFAYALDDATKTMTAEIEIANPDRALRPGMYASCQISLEKKTAAQLLPAEALMSDKAKSFVFACREGKAVRLPVKKGFEDGVSVEILEGLRPDEAVVLAGKQSLTDGQRLNPTEVK